ncbi:MAG: hypothetical protein P9M14_13520 [Candidatus Alcyoniella australis]|nr:hypothetical protein [Candidatus Alcyoniella australis]
MILFFFVFFSLIDWTLGLFFLEISVALVLGCYLYLRADAYAKSPSKYLVAMFIYHACLGLMVFSVYHPVLGEYFIETVMGEPAKLMVSLWYAFVFVVLIQVVSFIIWLIIKFFRKTVGMIASKPRDGE